MAERMFRTAYIYEEGDVIRQNHASECGQIGISSSIAVEAFLNDALGDKEI